MPAFANPNLTRLLRRCAFGVVVAVLLGLQGCATVTNPNPRDPFEGFNRTMFDFNEVLDQAVVKPVATGYKAITPDWFRRGVGNFFNNLGDAWSVVNNALQGRGQDASDSMGRVLINITAGLGGLIDVASDLNIERHPANFGLTLGRWGVPNGPYLVLPFLGMSTARDVAGMPLDRQGNLVNSIGDEPTRTGLTVLSAIDTRAVYLKAGDVVEEAALDKYSFMRDAYLQRLRNRVYDGNPPDEEDDPEPPPPAPAEPADTPAGTPAPP